MSACVFRMARWDGALNCARTRQKPSYPEWASAGKSTTDETQYAAYLATRLHATDDLGLLLGSRVIDWHRDIEDKPYNAKQTKTKESETGVYIPYAGVVYDVNETWSLYASYTKIFNPQSS